MLSRTLIRREIQNIFETKSFNKWRQNNTLYNKSCLQSAMFCSKDIANFTIV